MFLGVLENPNQDRTHTETHSNTLLAKRKRYHNPSEGVLNPKNLRPKTRDLQNLLVFEIGGSVESCLSYEFTNKYFASQKHIPFRLYVDQVYTPDLFLLTSIYTAGSTTLADLRSRVFTDQPNQSAMKSDFSCNPNDSLRHVNRPYTCTCTNIQYAQVLITRMKSRAVELLMASNEEKLVEYIQTIFLLLNCQINQLL